MSKVAVCFVIAVFAVLSAVSVFAQELTPVRVELSRISKTVFTNWEEIELTYTVGYMDGYEVIKNKIMPQAMSFGVLELDPKFAGKLDIRNTPFELRKFDKENYFDVVYHLRYMGEKKGEIIVPGQKFSYREVGPDSNKISNFPTPEFNLGYNTVLTKGANDIKDRIDFGSYKKQAMVWKVSAGVVFMVGAIGSLFLIFFKPVPVPLSPNEIMKETLAAKGIAVNPSVLIRKLEADIGKLRVCLSEQNSMDPSAVRREIGSICNGLRDVIRYYVPAINPGTCSVEMASSISSVPSVWEKQRLLTIYFVLVYMENILFNFADEGLPNREMFKSKVDRLTPIVKELRPSNVYWHRLPSRIFGKPKLSSLWRRHGKT